MSKKCLDLIYDKLYFRPMRNTKFNRTVFLFVTLLLFVFILNGCKHSVTPSKATTGKAEGSDIPGITSGENPGFKAAVYTAEKGILTITSPGILPEQDVTEALSGGTRLKVSGPSFLKITGYSREKE